MSENVSLTRNQRRALAALLDNATITDAAAACGLTDRTLLRYLENADFRAELARLEGDRIAEAGRRLVSGQADALDELECLMTGARSESVRLRAVTAWLEMLFRYRDLTSIEARLTELEKVQNAERSH